MIDDEVIFINKVARCIGLFIFVNILLGLEDHGSDGTMDWVAGQESLVTQYGTAAYLWLVSIYAEDFCKDNYFNLLIKTNYLSCLDGDSSKNY